jgi:uncharacterized protein YecE (DUF72 family)
MKNTSTLDLTTFRFRSIHPKISIGTASDRYAGWIGQIYTKERYQGRTTRRTNTVGGKSFIEEVLPVDSVEEYFEHFPLLEIDYTFYRPLLETDGKPSPNYHVRRRYQSYMKDKDCIVVKVPQMITAQKLRRGSAYRENETYLNADVFTRQFYEPAVDVLGPSLTGFLFEQEYQRKQDRTPISHIAQKLDAFFDAIPRDSRYHIELRTESYLSTPVFKVLEKHGVGQVLSHWTWLPPLRKQFAKANRTLFNAGRQCIVRLITPIGMRYEVAYEKAHPFDTLVEGMLCHEMVEETVSLMKMGIEEGVKMNIIINNRAGGNAPLIARHIAEEFIKSSGIV